MKTFFTALACTLFVSNTLANSVELSLSEQLVDLRLVHAVNYNFDGQLAGLHADFGNINTNMISYELYTEDQLDAIDFRLAAKTFWLDADSDQGYGLALGIGLISPITAKLVPELSVYYSPDIITGGDIDNYFELDARFSFKVVSNGSIYAGYRQIEIDTDGGDIDLYDSAYFGIRFDF